MDLQIVRKDRVTSQIGDQPERRGCDHHRHDGQPVQPVSEVHRIASADDHHCAKQDEEPAKIDQKVFEKRKGQLVGELWNRYLSDHENRSPGDRRLDGQPRFARQPFVGLFRDLQKVIVKANRAEPNRHGQHGPNQRTCKISPKQRGEDETGQDH